jgi:hypothetical protein
MWRRYKIITYLKDGLIDKGYNFKHISYLNSQIEILEKLIKETSFDTLNRLLYEKTNYRLLKQIEKGQENLVSILKYPEQWRLCKIENNYNEWINKNSLIFSTERELLCFTQNNYGQKYINNKWQ